MQADEGSYFKEATGSHPYWGLVHTTIVSNVAQDNSFLLGLEIELCTEVDR